MGESEELNKSVVARHFEMVYGDGSDLSPIDRDIAEDYVQHNPLAGQGREGVRRFFTEVLPLPLTGELDSSGTREVNLIAERDFVVRQEIRENGMLIDVFRLKDGLLVEHWDAFRPNPGFARPPGF